MKLHAFAILLITILIPIASHAVQTKSNGIYTIKFGEVGFPIITSIDILGRTVVPHNSVGADFQMTARSARGNSYNPTQGGDCNAAKSRLDSINMNFNTRVGLGSQYGFKWEVTPRNYNEPGQSASNPVGSCLPTMFPHAWRLPHACCSTDGVNFQQLTKIVNGAATGSNNSADAIDDYNWHTFRRVVAVGHFNSIKAIIRKADQEFRGGLALDRAVLMRLHQQISFNGKLS